MRNGEPVETQLPEHRVELPVVVALNAVLVRRVDVAVSLLSATVDRDGMHLDVLFLRDPVGRSEKHWPDGVDYVEAQTGDPSVPAWTFYWEALDVTVPLAGTDWNPGAVASVRTDGGGGHETLWSHGMYLTPIPKVGDLGVHLSWPDWTVEAHVNLDGNRLRSAQRQVR